MNNEPVAWMYRMKDSQNKWELIFNKPINDEFFETIPLYTHPADAEKVKENMDKVLKQNERLIEALANARITFDAEIEKKNTMLKMWEATHPAKTIDRELLDKTIIDQQNEIKELRKNLDVALMIVNEPAKTLTDEEIRQCILEYFESPEYKQYPLPIVSVQFARAILRKAQEK